LRELTNEEIGFVAAGHSDDGPTLAEFGGAALTGATLLGSVAGPKGAAAGAVMGVIYVGVKYHEHNGERHTLFIHKILGEGDDSKEPDGITKPKEYTKGN